MMIAALGTGAIFGTGLALAGMLNLTKVVGFWIISGCGTCLWGWQWLGIGRILSGAYCG